MIDICIPVKNEINNLNILAERIPPNYNVFVVNSGYDRDTENLCVKYHWNFIEFNWDGQYPKKRNWFLDNYNNALADWVLFLDADEHVSSDQLIILEKYVQNCDKFYDAFLLKYSVYFLGKKLKYTKPMSKISLIKKNLRYEFIVENRWSTLDMEIHEHPVVKKGRLGKINSIKIDHLENRKINNYIAKHNEYSDWESQRMMQVSQHTFRLIKYRLLGRLWMPRLYFLYIFFFRFGFMDGRRGYLFAKFKEFYFISIYAKRFEQDI